MSAQSEAAALPTHKHRVVIIGSGFGGLTATQKLKRADVDVKLIARTTHHLFQPLLYQVATGIISEGDIAPATTPEVAGERAKGGLTSFITTGSQKPVSEAYKAVDAIDWSEGFCRRDIGWRAVERERA